MTKTPKSLIIGESDSLILHKKIRYEQNHQNASRKKKTTLQDQ